MGVDKSFPIYLLPQFSLQVGEIDFWWAWGENTRAPSKSSPFLPLNQTSKTTICPPIFLSPFFILPDQMDT